MKKFIALALALVMTLSLCACGNSGGSEDEIAEKVAGMTTEQKLAQMMVVALRADSGSGKAATELTPAYEELIKKYDFGGVILFEGNIVDMKQTVKLISDCQKAAAGSEAGVPLLMCLDQEGGAVNRIKFGAAGPGNMALAAAGDTKLTKESAGMLGEEIAALGFNVDFAPVCDVNNNPANPVIGVRAFSDDPAAVSEHVLAYLEGLQKNNIAASLKHFPGHGNVSKDSHSGLPKSELTLEELKECELVPFQAGIDAGAEMVMTAHIQYPNIEKETYKSNKDKKKVNLPATFSRAIINDLLREDMGYNGIVVTDALDMEAITEHFKATDAAVMAINAGADILLCPVDLYQDDKTDTFPQMEKYISRLAKRVEAGDIKEEELDDSVTRILKLKYEKGIMDNAGKDEAEDILANAEKVVGSEKHLTRDWEIAEKGMTLVKNRAAVLPLDGKSSRKTVILSPNEYRLPSVEYALERLQKEDVIDPSNVTVINYKGMDFKDDQMNALNDAEQLIILSQTAKRSDLVDRAIWRVHQNDNGKAVLISLGLPYDAATYDDVDAILCAYNPSGSAYDAEGNGPFNLNVAVALSTIFGQNKPQGKLPVNVPAVEFGKDGAVKYTDHILYKRGTGLKNWK